jgi:hypothetical protein
MNAGTLFRIRYSKDQAAYADVVRLERELETAGRFRRGRIETELDDARERCLKAGVDWERAPKPPRDLRVPDRSGRVRVGAPDARAPAGWKPEPPAGGQAPPLSLSGTLSFTSQAAAASRTPVSSPSTPSYTGGGTGTAATATAAYGAADAGSFTTLAATEWLGSNPTPSYSDAAGNSWLEGPDGSLWFTDPTGAAYTVGADGNFFALSPDGMLYGQAPDGTSVTWAPDGTPLTMDDGGLLWAADMPQPTLYGEDGGFYAPDDAIGMVSYEDPLAGMLPGLADDGVTAEDPAFDVADELPLAEDPVYEEITVEEYTIEEYAGDELYIEDDGFSDGAYAPDDLGEDGWADVPDVSLPEPEDGWRGLDDASWDA